jgi:hypothetical protein
VSDLEKDRKRIAAKRRMRAAWPLVNGSIISKMFNPLIKIFYIIVASASPRRDIEGS